MRLHELFESSEEERLNIVKYIEDEYRLPNLHNVIPPEQMRKVPYKNQSKVVIHRGVPDGVDTIRPGDWVALSYTYAREHIKGGHIISKTVPAEDVAWTGTDMNEFYYVPKID